MNVSTQDIKIFRSLVIQGLPRQGKTRLSIEKMLDFDSAIYITHRHEILKHVVRILKELTNEKTCVWVEGKRRTCKTGTLNCNSCKMKPSNNKEEHIPYFKLDLIVEKLLDKYRVLTKEIIEKSEKEMEDIVEEYGGICPYYALKIAARKAKYIFTVPQLAKEAGHADLLIIDEDPTFDYFYPKSVCICEYTHGRYEKSVKILIPAEITKLKEVKKIHHAKAIRECAKTIEEILEILNKFKEGEISIKEVVEKINEIKFPKINDPEKVLEKIEEIIVDDKDIILYFHPILFPAPKRVFVERNTNNSKIKLWLIADEEKICRDVPASKYRILIGSTRAEVFAKQQYGEYKKIVVDRLDHLKNFAIFVVGSYKKNSKGIEYLSREKTKKLLRSIASKFAHANIPVIMVTGSEEQQMRCEAKLREHYVLTHSIKNEKIEQIFDVYLMGGVSIIYANSSISRGVDLDFYDVEIMYNIDFSTPYWSAMAEYWKEQKGKHRSPDREGDPAEEKSIWYEGVREKIIGDEMFNLLFRIAPIKGRWEDKLKLVFIPEYYLDRIALTAIRIGGIDLLKALENNMIYVSIKSELEDLRKNSDGNKTKFNLSSITNYEKEDDEERSSTILSTSKNALFLKSFEKDEDFVNSIPSLFFYLRRIHKNRDFNKQSNLSAEVSGASPLINGNYNLQKDSDGSIKEIIECNSVAEFVKNALLKKFTENRYNDSDFKNIEKSLVSLLKRKPSTETLWLKLRSKFDFLTYRDFKRILNNLLDRGVIKCIKKKRKYIWLKNEDDKTSSNPQDVNTVGDDVNTINEKSDKWNNNNIDKSVNKGDKPPPELEW